ncbi:hypothetical protein CDAR_212011 [Caerostris darwini]|uniref:Uncharacterized protein n=1 Tax=Caerostris darwini TaxID=1538125 RepID=A0AAV4TZP8_9ARAC|nr:hypothetical protein CDAR_212011 [Caerostris darwini]
MSRSVSLSCPGGGCLQIRWWMLILGEEKPVPGITTLQENQFPPQLKEKQRVLNALGGEGVPDMSRSVLLSCPCGGCLQIRWRMLILGEEKPVPGITTLQEKSVPPPTT